MIERTKRVSGESHSARNLRNETSRVKPTKNFGRKRTEEQSTESRTKTTGERMVGGESKRDRHDDVITKMDDLEDTRGTLGG